MKNYSRLVLVCICLVGASLPLKAQTKKVLFLGNSYTGANNLPNLIYLLALSNNDTLDYDSNTPGGYTYEAHSTNTTSLNKIAAQDWDHVVLQEQSQRPSFPPAQVANEVYPYAEILVDSILSNNPCTEPIFYMTWGRKNGDQSNCASYPPICTFEGMSDRLRTSYLQMTNDHSAICAPAGSAWWHSRIVDNSIELYSADGSHPNINGSYLTACVFYATIWRKSPVGLSYTAGIGASVAAHLQQVAHTTVFDSLSTWRIGLDDPMAGFEFSDDGSGNFSFTDTSSNAISYQWSFGDGAGHTGQNPNHSYTNSGQYTVELIISDGCTSDTAQSIVNVQFTGVISHNKSNFNIYPNPSAETITIQSQEVIENVKIYAVNGSLVIESAGNKAIDITQLQSGTYMVHVNGKFVDRLIVK